jgi:hypothetical protein
LLAVFPNVRLTGSVGVRVWGGSQGVGERGGSFGQ